MQKISDIHNKKYDLLVIGSGPSGMIASITVARAGYSVLLLEKEDKSGKKLLASGGGRCNLTNTLPKDEFMRKIGQGTKKSLFLKPSFDHFFSTELRGFFHNIGVDTKVSDGFRVFPDGHSSLLVVKALLAELNRLKVEIKTNTKVTDLILDENRLIKGVTTNNQNYYAENFLFATGGKGYPKLGGSESGYRLLEKYGHKITKLYPGMVKLLVSEKWVGECKADTLGKVILTFKIKNKSYKYSGDLIFTDTGLMGPLVQDVSREITPLLENNAEVKVLLNTAKGLNDADWELVLKKNRSSAKTSQKPLIEIFSKYYPRPFFKKLCQFSNINEQMSLSSLAGNQKEQLFSLFRALPLTITGSEGFPKAMVTRGGVRLKDVDQNSLKSKVLTNLYLAGEVLDLDGPCGGYNLQMCFSMGAFAGNSIIEELKNRASLKAN